MTIDFDFGGLVTTEFGVGSEGDAAAGFDVVPVDAGVKSALRSMAEATIDKMEAVEGGASQYEPAEKHGSTEYLVVPAGGSLDATIRGLHDAENLPVDGAGLLEPKTLSCYFARFTDGEHRRLTAIRRATQFKGVLKSRLARFVNDTLRIVEDDVFKLDNDFDLLLDSAFTHIWRPSAFEFLGGLKQAILGAVPANVGAIASELPFVDLSDIEQYARSRPRAARYLASIRSQELQGMDRDALIELCVTTGVGIIQEANGQIAVQTGDEMGFLEVLDRRRYRLELVPDQPERFRAQSRQKIVGMQASSGTSPAQ